VRFLCENGADKHRATPHGTTPMHIAAQHGHCEAVLALSDNGADQDRATEEGLTPLYIAAQQGHLDVVGALCANRADTARATQKGVTPLYIAAQKGRTEMVRLLCSHGAAKNKSMQHGATPMHIAADHGHAEVLRVLCENGADREAKTQDGATPLCIATDQGHAAAVQVLCDCGASKNHAALDGRTPLYLAAQHGRAHVVQIICESRADVDKAKQDGRTPLYIASQHGHCEVVAILSKFGADKDLAMCDGATPLFIAAGSGYDDVVFSLCESRADVSKSTQNGTAPLHLAAGHGHVDVMRILCDHGAEEDVASVRGATPLHFASTHGCHSAALLLLGRRADVNRTQVDGATPLCLAAQQGHAALIRLLCAESDRCPALDTCSPIHLAAQHGQLDAVVALFELGVHVDSFNSEGITPLYCASSQGHLGIVSFLCLHGADMDKPGPDGSTPLHTAACHGFDLVVQHLCAQGADVEKMTHSGLTPLLMAVQRGHTGIVSTLCRNGAHPRISDFEGARPFQLDGKQGCLKARNASPGDGCGAVEEDDSLCVHYTMEDCVVELDEDLETAAPSEGRSLETDVEKIDAQDYDQESGCRRHGEENSFTDVSSSEDETELRDEVESQYAKLPCDGGTQDGKVEETFTAERLEDTDDDRGNEEDCVVELDEDLEIAAPSEGRSLEPDVEKIGAQDYDQESGCRRHGEANSFTDVSSSVDETELRNEVESQYAKRCCDRGTPDGVAEEKVAADRLEDTDEDRGTEEEHSVECPAPLPSRRSPKGCEQGRRSASSAAAQRVCCGPRVPQAAAQRCVRRAVLSAPRVWPEFTGVFVKNMRLCHHERSVGKRDGQSPRQQPTPSSASSQKVVKKCVQASSTLLSRTARPVAQTGSSVRPAVLSQPELRSPRGVLSSCQRFSRHPVPHNSGRR